jgi:hypothetical protein
MLVAPAAASALTVTKPPLNVSNNVPALIPYASADTGSDVAPALTAEVRVTLKLSNLNLVPATIGTDFAITYPEPQLNNNTGGYHSGVLQTITTSAAVALGATTISVASLGIALAAGTRLRFESFSVTLTVEI